MQTLSQTPMRQPGQREQRNESTPPDNDTPEYMTTTAIVIIVMAVLAIGLVWYASLYYGSHYQTPAAAGNMTETGGATAPNENNNVTGATGGNNVSPPNTNTSPDTEGGSQSNTTTNTNPNAANDNSNTNPPATSGTTR